MKNDARDGVIAVLKDIEETKGREMVQTHRRDATRGHIFLAAYDRILADETRNRIWMNTEDDTARFVVKDYEGNDIMF